MVCIIKARVWIDRAWVRWPKEGTCTDITRFIFCHFLLTFYLFVLSAVLVGWRGVWEGIGFLIRYDLEFVQKWPGRAWLLVTSHDMF